MNKYWIPGPITNYGTTDAGFRGEVRVVLASDHEARLDELQQVIDDRDKALGFEILSPETQAAFRASVQEIDGINLRRVKELEERLAEADAANGELRFLLNEASAGDADIQLMFEERDELRKRLADTQAGAELLSRQSNDYEARLAEAERVIAEYATHSQGCPVIFDDSLCTCGLTKARAAVSADGSTT